MFIYCTMYVAKVKVDYTTSSETWK